MLLSTKKVIILFDMIRSLCMNLKFLLENVKTDKTYKESYIKKNLQIMH